MNSISISRLVVVVLIAFVASFSTVFGDGIRSAEAHTLVELGAVMAVYGGKAVAAGLTAAIVLRSPSSRCLLRVLESMR
jgi:hypothetical protein